MASGFLSVTGPRPCEFGFKLAADHRGNGVIVDVQVVSLLHPLAQGFIGGQARGLPERLLQRRQHVWRERHGFTGRPIQRQ